ncbi:transposase [Micromonospora sp. NBC_01699]|uniref:transposase n=1 Tax=Micromonospora sp. NBC_01699 TaxID=2975984 RepID=UPI002E28F871|nr:transposase [Micromonospora sp. NBC_01699]
MAKKPARYSPELRAEAVKAVIEGQRSYADVARDFGLIAETVRNWVIAEKKKNPGGSDDAREAIDRVRTAEMERRIRELEQENAFLKKAAAFFAREQR